MFSGKSTRPDAVKACFGTRTFFLLLALFLGAYFAVYLGFCGSLHRDEADQILFSQSLALGYHEQPPLYSWLIWAFFRVLGRNLVALALLKTVILGSVYTGLYLSARFLLGDARLAALAAFSPFLMFSFAWHSISYLTHTNLLCATFVGACYALLRLLRSGKWREYVFLGLMLGLGTLSKYNFVLFGGALLLAGLMTRPLRERLLNLRTLAALAVAAAFVFPHWLFLANHLDQLVAIKHKVCAEPCLAGFVLGGGNLISNVLFSVTPLAIIGLLFFPQATRLAKAPVTLATYAVRFLEHYFLIAFGLFLLVVAGGAAYFCDRWLYPLVLPAPIYLFARFWDREVSLSRLQRFGYLLAGCGLILIVVRAGQLMMGGSSSCPYSLRSFAEAADQLDTAGGSGTIMMASRRELGGNLCYWLPQMRHLSADRDLYLAGAQNAQGPFVLIWDTVEGEGLPPTLVHFLRQEFDLGVKPEEPIRFVDATGRGNIPHRLGYVIIAPEMTANAALECPQ